MLERVWAALLLYRHNSIWTYLTDSQSEPCVCAHAVYHVISLFDLWHTGGSQPGSHGNSCGVKAHNAPMRPDMGSVKAQVKTHFSLICASQTPGTCCCKQYQVHTVNVLYPWALNVCKMIDIMLLEDSLVWYITRCNWQFECEMGSAGLPFLWSGMRVDSGWRSSSWIWFLLGWSVLPESLQGMRIRVGIIMDPFWISQPLPGETEREREREKEKEKENRKIKEGHRDVNHLS